MSVDALSNLIADFGASIGLPELCLDEDGRVNLEFDDIPISIESSSRDDAVSIYSLIDRLPPGVRHERLYAKLLNANYLHRETDGGALGVDADTGNIVLVREHNLAAMRPGDFEANVERFINLAERWRRVVYDAYQDAGSSPADSGSQQPAAPFAGTKV